MISGFGPYYLDILVNEAVFYSLQIYKRIYLHVCVCVCVCCVCVCVLCVCVCVCACVCVVQ